MLPEAKIIHIVRDGRDVAVSLRNKWFGPGDHMKKLAKVWCDYILAARQATSERFLEIRFEELILSLEETIKRICQFLELEESEAMFTLFSE